MARARFPFGRPGSLSSPRALSYLVDMVARQFSGLLVLTLMGCYQTVPVASSAPRAGSEIEIRLTDNGSASLRELVGAGVTTVRGNYQGSSADTLRLNVLGVTRRNGSEDFWKGEPVGLLKADIATLGERKLSRARTGAVVAVGAIALSLIKLGFEGKTNTTGTPRPIPSGQ